MTIKDYLLFVIEQGYFKNMKWFFSLFAVHQEGYEDEYLLVKNGVPMVKVDKELHVLNNNGLTEPVIHIKDRLKMSKGEILNLDIDIETSVGLLLVNLIRLSIPFNGKIKYINKMFTDKDIEKQLPELLNSKKVTIDEYLAYADSVSYILPLANLFTYSATVKTITPPPDMEKRKKEITEEFNTKYGKEWVNIPARGVEYGGRLKEIDTEYLKDDPSYGKMLSGKVTNNSRPRLYGSFGVEYGFDDTGKSAKFIQNSLSEGYPTDKESLATLFNSARAASYGRGKETQKGGSLAKDMLRPTSSLKIIDGDCGTKKGRTVTMTEHTAYRYTGSYVLENGKTTLIENPENYIGKEVVIRSPQYCITSGENFCEYCMNETMKNFKDGLSLLMVEAGGIVLNSSMKGMHKAVKKTVLYNIVEVIK